MDKIIKMSEVKQGMMVKFAGKFRLVLATDRKENILTIRVNGKAQLFAPHSDIEVEVRIK
ncbi:hypothetical protein PKP126_029 [Klebsiella phage PKP126]|uniref:Uncharacterized protein n=1 Tax=Klebsiella phage PKP126 TaxID=1654927 RepID=A0A159B7G4_9CAUD|nr:hypothetical protein BI015_gp29 [Klebsiella phage PKP126]AKJ72965.1 hypothetical protein PKP126_029 [Klebsiella phage PKP126]